MDEVIGTAFLVCIVGVVIGDEIWKKIFGWLLLGTLVIAFIISPSLAISLVLVPIILGGMVVCSIISFFKRL